MVRHYRKKTGNPYVERSRLNEAQFIAIAAGYLTLFTPRETEQYIKQNKEQLFKDWSRGGDSVSKNTIIATYKKIDLRIAHLLENNALEGFPYGLKGVDDPKEKQMRIDETLSRIYELLTDTISKEDLFEIHEIWRGINENAHFMDSLIFQGTKQLWNKSAGLDYMGLRLVFSRVAFISYFVIKNPHLNREECVNLAMEKLFEHLKQFPL